MASPSRAKKKTAAAVPPATPDTPTADAIARRAYEIFLARHGAPGDPLGDWLQAERELGAS